MVMYKIMRQSRHCEERSDEANSGAPRLLRCARNDRRRGCRPHVSFYLVHDPSAAFGRNQRARCSKARRSGIMWPVGAHTNDHHAGGQAMEQFLSIHQEAIVGTLTMYDRI